jgi:hypothetical protein
MLGLGRLQHSRLRRDRAAAPKVYGRAADVGAAQVHDQFTPRAGGGSGYDGAQVQVKKHTTITDGQRGWIGEQVCDRKISSAM